MAEVHADSMYKMKTLFYSNAALAEEIGQNLYKKISFPSLRYSDGEIANKWYSEGIYYNYRTFSSNVEGQLVNHFTTLIWKNAVEVGLDV